jgi:ubiquinone/menaquinone biosynthesis C-methylase UbiE
VEKLEENLQNIDDADRILKEANRVASKPNCILNIIIIVLLAILGYFIVRKISQDNS